MVREKKESPMTCPEECNNTGIVIFLTTLIVTVLHLTLATTVYLYLSKLKRIARQKSFHPNFLTSNSRLDSLTPSSSSSISSLGGGGGRGAGDDTLSYAEAEGFTTGSVASMGPFVNGLETMPVGPNPVAVNLAARLREEMARPKAAKWFGMPNEGEESGIHSHPQMPPHLSNGNMRSAFNREILFGPREQRFLGLNNYAFNGGTSGPSGGK